MAEEVSSSSGSLHSDSGRKICQVCGDVSTGYYYNVWSCEGCKAFFKRCLQVKEGAQYVCPATNNCTIDKTRRKCCQACRLRKCYAAGMQKIGSRRDRSRKSKANPSIKDDVSSKASKRKRINTNIPDSVKEQNLSSTPPSVTDSCLESDVTEVYNRVSCQNDNIVKSPASDTNTSDASSSNQLLNSSIPNITSLESPGKEIKETKFKGNTKTMPHSDRDLSPEGLSEMPIHPIVSSLIEIEPPERLSNHVKSEKETEESLMTSFVKLADQELVDVISWAKNMPAFSSLDFADKIHLVDCCWMEVLICGLCWRSKDAGENILRFAEDLVCDRDMYYTAGIGPICDRMAAIARDFKDLNLSREEFVCIRALTLLNADLTNLQERDALIKARQGIMDALLYTQQRLNASPNRIFTILLLLPHLRQCGVNATAHMFEMQHEEAFPIAHLVKEMLQVQNTYTAKSPDENSGLK